MAFIGFGKFNLNYAFIFSLVFFKFVSDYLEGFNEKNYYNRSKREAFGDFGSIFAYHPLFRDFMFFFGSALCGIILYYFYRKNEKLKNGLMSLEKINIFYFCIKYFAKNLFNVYEIRCWILDIRNSFCYIFIY